MTEPQTVAPGLKPFVDYTAEAQDHPYFEFFESLHLKLDLPNIAGWQVTKFHVLLGFSALLTAFILTWLGRRMRSGAPPRGVAQGIAESLVYLVRDQIARPAIDHKDHHGHVHHDGDKYVPFLGTTFLFVLIANMLGMVPFLGSPTASIAVTSALALVVFLYTHFSGVQQNGFAGYAKSSMTSAGSIRSANTARHSAAGRHRNAVWSSRTNAALLSSHRFWYESKRGSAGSMARFRRRRATSGRCRAW